ncbi:MAG: zf-HC2 domain-containing protein [Phycisphaerales bacterium]|nr:zf-HC2 domain-containing protein [Phycisphaerales bacterium]
MKNCDDMRELLGPHVDGEGSPEARAAIEAHLCTCAECRCEVEGLRELGSRIAAGAPTCVPPALWRRIESQLDAAAPRHGLVRILRLRSILAAAACLVLAVGGYYAILQGLSTRAEAAPVSFSMLLDGLSVDAEKAFRQFVELYRGRPVSAYEARKHAAQLNFAIPQKLPGGFELEGAFALQIGDNPAAAALYRRNGEFVGTIFHRAIHPEDYGTHRDHPCVVGEHRGHQVEVGEWRLVHVTDATTCHCVLSRLDEKSELPPILDIVAPHTNGAAPPHNDRP